MINLGINLIFEKKTQIDKFKFYSIIYPKHPQSASVISESSISWQCM